MRLAALALLPLLASADLLDRLAVTVGNQAITETQIRQDINLAALVNGDTPDYSDASRRKSAQRLIEQAFVKIERGYGSYPPASAAEVDQSLAETRKTVGPALDAKLAAYRLTEKDLRGYLEWQLDLLKFIDLRFRPAVQVTDADIENYYKTNLSTSGKDLASLHDQIEQTLTGQRVDEQVNRWLEQVRRRTKVTYLDPSLEPATPPPAR